MDQPHLVKTQEPGPSYIIGCGSCTLRAPEGSSVTPRSSSFASGKASRRFQRGSSKTEKAGKVLDKLSSELLSGAPLSMQATSDWDQRGATNHAA